MTSLDTDTTLSGQAEAEQAPLSDPLAQLPREVSRSTRATHPSGISWMRVREFQTRLKKEGLRLGQYTRMHGIDFIALVGLLNGTVKGSHGKPREVALDMGLLGTFPPTHDHPHVPAFIRAEQVKEFFRASKGEPPAATPQTQICFEKLDEVRMRLCAQGVTAEQWAMENGFPLKVVREVFDGLDRGLEGSARQVAQKLGVLGDPYIEQHLLPVPRKRPKGPTDQISMSRLATMNALFKDCGMTADEWARRNRFAPHLVESVLKGENQCITGHARRIAARMYVLGDPFVELHDFPQPPAKPLTTAQEIKGDALEKRGQEKVERKVVKAAKKEPVQTKRSMWIAQHMPRLEVSWKRVGMAIDRLDALGQTPEDWAEELGYAWRRLRPVFEEAQTPPPGVALMAAVELDLLGPPEMAQHVYPQLPESRKVSLPLKWPVALQRWLKSDAPEVITRQELHVKANALGRTLDKDRVTSQRAIIKWTQKNVEDGVLQQHDQVFVNTLAKKQGSGYGIAHKVHAGAVVSLWTVLIQEGVVDGAVEIITCVTGKLTTLMKSPAKLLNVEGYMPFEFHEIDEVTLERAQMHPLDSLDARYPYPVATPERALLDWLAVHRRKGPTWVRLPPLKMRVGMLNGHRLDRLAKEMDMVEVLGEWMARHKKVMSNAGKEGGPNYRKAPSATNETVADDIEIVEDQWLMTRLQTTAEGAAAPQEEASPVDWAQDAWPD